MKTLKARDLWEQIGHAAWASADPGLHFNTTMNDWHTCPAEGPIRASNPCSEYMFLDDTACNLASLNLLQFKDAGTKRIDIADYEHAVRLWTIVLEVSVMMAQFPSHQIAERSYKYRTLGLGYANIGGLLMTTGIPYDSKEGRAICGALTAIMTGVSYATSAEMAAEIGTFPGYKDNKKNMLRVIRNHRRAAHGESTGYENLSVNPVALIHEDCPDPDLVKHATAAWDKALELGEKHGYRNAQATVIAPTGTIGLVMDCDTTGIEPDFRACEVQEARRRRLLQDHQQRGARGPAHARLFRSPAGRDRGLCGRSWQHQPGARHQSRLAQGQGLHRRPDRHRQRRHQGRLRHQVRLQQVDAGRGVLQIRARPHRRADE